MASIILDVSSKLGEYLLKGWVLTDEICDNNSCHTPLLRSPKGQKPEIYFCANCDGEPVASGSRNGDKIRLGQGSATARPSSPSLARSSGSSELESRPSTPATDAPSLLDSPTFEPPPPTAETLRRRQQSDAAAAEIGARLLKGWAMLADECPTSTCFGIPLVRPPQHGDEKSANKECVACGTMFIGEGQGLVAVNTNSNVLAIDDHDGATRNLPGTASAQSGARLSGRRPSSISSRRLQDSENKLSAVASTQVQGVYASLDSASASLDVTMKSLSKRLAVQSSNSDGMDVMSIGNTVDVLGKVLGVMERIQNLRSSSGP